MTIYTAGHGTRTAEELVAILRKANIETVVDVRRYPSSRRNPQFNLGPLSETLAGAGIQYRHVEALGGRRSGERGEERFACIRPPAFAGYAARMGRREWQEALASMMNAPTPCFLCAETDWRRCHRKLISELLVARGYRVLHLLPDRAEPHRLSDDAEVRDGRLYLCGELAG
jgi:uncharacterized protein (DUF488 family)